MKKLGKKRTGNNNTVQAYACGGAFCVCKACAAASVDSMLYIFMSLKNNISN